MGKVSDEAEKLAQKLGVSIHTTVEAILRDMGGRTRNEIPRSVWGYTLLELVRCAVEDRDSDAQSAKKILSQQSRLHGKNHPG